MTYPILPLSYPAGSSSTDPDRYRFIQPGHSQRLMQLNDLFPDLRKDINSSAIIVDAYPASLGLVGIAPSIDTYLHSPTFISALRLARQELRPVFLAAQPLVGAGLLLEVSKSEFQLPRRILWGTGGYLMPNSLESFVKEVLRSLGCEIRFLYSYGVAEIGHTCFAATERSDAGHPCYRKVAPSVTADIVGDDRQLRLASPDGRQVLTGDHASVSEGVWTLTSGGQRVHPDVLAELECWSHEDWSRRTGYLHATPAKTFIQLRPGIDVVEGTSEVEFYDFWRRFEGSLTTKPVWKLHE